MAERERRPTVARESVEEAETPHAAAVEPPVQPGGFDDVAEGAAEDSSGVDSGAPAQGALFGPVVLGGVEAEEPPPKKKRASRWRMPESDGSTVAELRLRWGRRLTPAQVARVESEIEALPRLLRGLGFGPVELERYFVRRKKK